jgi:hypothetical protein
MFALGIFVVKIFYCVGEVNRFRQLGKPAIHTNQNHSITETKRYYLESLLINPQILSLWSVSSASGNSDATLSGSWGVSGVKGFTRLHDPKADEAVARKLLKNKRLRNNIARQVPDNQGIRHIYISASIGAPRVGVHDDMNGQSRSPSDILYLNHGIALHKMGLHTGIPARET